METVRQLLRNGWGIAFDSAVPFEDSATVFVEHTGENPIVWFLNEPDEKLVAELRRVLPSSETQSAEDMGLLKQLMGEGFRVKFLVRHDRTPMHYVQLSRDHVIANEFAWGPDESVDVLAAILQGSQAWVQEALRKPSDPRASESTP